MEYNNGIVIYADDTVIICANNTINSVKEQVSNTLLHIDNYCKNNLLFLNTSKTKIVIFPYTKSISFTNCFLLNNNILGIVQEYTYLGYPIDNKLKFKAIIDKLSTKLKGCNYMLQRMRPLLPKKILYLIFNALGQSYLIYYKSILNVLTSNQVKPIMTLITHSSAIIDNCLIKNVSNKQINYDFIIDYYLSICLIKIFKLGFSPCLYKFQNKPQSYLTRSREELYINVSNSNLISKSFSYYAPNKLNAIPSHMMSMENNNMY